MIKTTPFPTTFIQDFPGLWGPRILHVASQPFDVYELQKRILQKTKDGKKAKPAFYIDARTLDHRLNLMFGGAWSLGFNIDEGEKFILARATLNINGVVREDISSEPVMVERAEYKDNKFVGKIMVPNDLGATSAQASAYKRAAVKFGIAAYLYDFKDEVIWDDIDPKWKNQFKDPTIKLASLPNFARPLPGAQIIMDELIYLCNSEDPKVLKTCLKTYWGIETLKNLNRDESFMLGACIARVSDLLSFTGKSIDQICEERLDGAKKSPSLGFNRE